MSKELLHEWVNIAWYAERTLMQRRFRVTITFLHAAIHGLESTIAGDWNTSTSTP